MCNSFAVYSEKAVYGMNFDYDNVTVKMKLVKEGNRKVFKLYFINISDAPIPFEICVAAMDDTGVFANIQTLIPNDESKYETYYMKNKTLSNWFGVLFSKKSQVVEDIISPCFKNEELSLTFKNVESANDILDKIKKTKHIFVPIIGVPKHHSLIADKSGNAFVFEIIDGHNDITIIKENYIIMSNFPNGEFKDCSYKEVFGRGDECYKKLYEFIESKRNDFNEKDAKKALESVQNDNTLVSMIFLPEEQKIEIYFNGEFKETFCFSFADEKMYLPNGNQITIDINGSDVSDLISNGIVKTSHK